MLIHMIGVIHFSFLVLGELWKYSSLWATEISFLIYVLNAVCQKGIEIHEFPSQNPKEEGKTKSVSWLTLWLQTTLFLIFNLHLYPGTNLTTWSVQNSSLGLLLQSKLKLTAIAWIKQTLAGLSGPGMTRWQLPHLASYQSACNSWAWPNNNCPWPWLLIIYSL